MDTILIVDDNKNNIQILGNILSENKYDVEFALSGVEAIEKIKAEQFDLILLDILMPLMDGYETCKRIKSINSKSEIPIIFISAKNDEDSISKGFKYGGVDYISKPFNERELLARVKTHIELKKSKEILCSALAKEKELVAMKSRFVSMASHEFRTPLATIGFTAGFLKKYWKKLEENEREKKMQKIELQISHMTDLLDNVLTLGMTEAKQLKFKPNYIDFNQFISPIISEVLNLTNNTHEIKLENTSTIDKVMIDEKLGRNIFINLLSNAIKFSPDNDYIDLHCSNDSEFFCCEIIDYGIGINKEEQECVFEPFCRGNNVGEISGTGLGLAIVKECVEHHKGTISVESHKGKGTKFTVKLPL